MFDGLDDINVCSGKVMVAVVSLCPELKRVTFVGGKQTPESSDEGEPDESSDEGESDESCDDASDTDGDVDAEETGDVDDVEAIQSILRVPDTFKVIFLLSTHPLIMFSVFTNIFFLIYSCSRT